MNNGGETAVVGCLIGVVVGFFVGLYCRSETTQPIETEIVDPANGARRLAIRADNDNQCYSEVTVTGSSGKPVRLRFLMDSGAAENMSLTQRDARYLGFNTAKLDYSDSYQAWGSVGYQANVTLREVRVNSLVLRNIKASIAQTSGADEVSLLGANILKTLNFQIRNGSCIVTIPSRRQT